MAHRLPKQASRRSALSTERLAQGLGATLLTTGALHFLVPKPYDQIIPEEIPGDPRVLTYVSGAAEIAIGAGLLAPQTRRASGGLATALFVAVYPANINMVRLWWRKPVIYRAIAIGRLPLQIPLVWAGLRIWREA
ncbi:membrane protein [Gordonia sinesedis]